MRCLRRVWECYYAIDGETDVAFGIAALLAPAGCYVEALEYLGISRATSGPKASVAYNAALCHMLLGDRAAALAELDEALTLEPEMEAARKLRDDLRTGDELGPSG